MTKKKPEIYATIIVPKGQPLPTDKYGNLLPPDVIYMTRLQKERDVKYLAT